MIKRLSFCVTAADELSFEEFTAQHNHYVLVVLPPGDDASGHFHTTEFGGKGTEMRPTIDDRYRVAPLVKRSGAHAFSMFLTVGRAANNDIVLRDIEVSKVHAYFYEDPQGNWSLCDSASTNGTFLNGSRVSADEKELVRSADTLRFGGLSAVFFNTSDFYQFLRSREVVAAILGR